MRSPEDLLRAQLFERRIVFLRGALDDALAGDVAAQLMTLDASGDDPVQLHVDSPGGPLEPAFVLIDTIGLLGVPVLAIIPQGVKLLHKEPGDAPDAEAYRLVPDSARVGWPSASAAGRLRT